MCMQLSCSKAAAHATLPHASSQYCTLNNAAPFHAWSGKARGGACGHSNPLSTADKSCRQSGHSSTRVAVGHLTCLVVRMAAHPTPAVCCPWSC